MAKRPEFGFVIGADHKQLLDQYFEPRGLNFKALGCEYASATTAAKLMGFACGAGIVIPYFDPYGVQLVDGEEGFIRIRLWPQVGKTKYRQRRGSHIHVYLTPELEWSSWLNDVTMPLMITEGEMKAAKVCLTGKPWPPAIGLGGVYSWTRKGSPRLIPELEYVDWRGRTVYICFDADQETKPDVKAAQTRLASVLEVYGAKPMILSLSLTGRGVKGVDDYIASGGVWEALKATAVEGDRSLLAMMLARYGILRNIEGIIDLEKGSICSVNYFHHMFSNQFMDSGNKRSLVTRLWMASERRMMVETPILRPDLEGGLVELDGGLYYNTWRGYTYSPVKHEEYSGVVERWERFVRELIGDPKLERLFHQWVAWFVRNPDQRNYTSWVFASAKEGVGKSLIGETIAEMIGSGAGAPARVIGPDDLFHHYPTYAEGTILVVCNEISDSRDRHRAKMKSLRTDDSLRVERKNVQPYFVDNYLNFIVSTNEMYAYGMSEDSRRDIVVEVCIGWTHEEVLEWSNWVSDEVGVIRHTPEYLECLMYYYMNVVNVEGYDHRMRAPSTEAKTMMAEAAQGGILTIRNAARDLVETWGGKGVIPSEWLRGWLSSRCPEAVEKYEVFSRLVREAAGYMPPSDKRVVKVSGATIRCLIFGANPVETGGLDKPAELMRSRELLGFSGKFNGST